MCFLTPGKKREKNQSIIGHWSEEYLDKVQVVSVFLGTSGLLNSDWTNMSFPIKN